MKGSNLRILNVFVGVAGLALLALATTARANEVSFEGTQTEGQTVSSMIAGAAVENYTVLAADIPGSTDNVSVAGGTLVKPFGNTTFPDNSNVYATANTCSGCTSTITIVFSATPVTGVRFSVTAANGTTDNLKITANDGESATITASDLGDIVNFAGPLTEITISLTNSALTTWSYAIDDIKFSTGVVPEPGSLALILFGLLAVGTAVMTRRGQERM